MWSAIAQTTTCDHETYYSDTLLGEADQHGVDLVIDIFGPDGKLIRTVDSPNGTEGPEPIDLTAFTSGQYKLVIHTLDPGAHPGDVTTIKVTYYDVVGTDGRLAPFESFTLRRPRRDSV